VSISADDAPRVAVSPSWEGAPLLLSVPRAAELLGISKTTLRRFIATGALPTVRLGDRVLLRPEDLERFVYSRLNQPM